MEIDRLVLNSKMSVNRKVRRQKFPWAVDTVVSFKYPELFKTRVEAYSDAQNCRGVAIYPFTFKKTRFIIKHTLLLQLRLKMARSDGCISSCICQSSSCVEGFKSVFVHIEDMTAGGRYARALSLQPQAANNAVMPVRD